MGKMMRRLHLHVIWVNERVASELKDFTTRGSGETGVAVAPLA